MNMGSFALILFVMHFAVHGPLRVHVLGWICVSVAVSVFAAPLSIMVSKNSNSVLNFKPFRLIPSILDPIYVSLSLILTN